MHYLFFYILSTYISFNQYPYIFTCFKLVGCQVLYFPLSQKEEYIGGGGGGEVCEV